MIQNSRFHWIYAATLLVGLVLVPHVIAHAQSAPNASGGNFVPLTSIPAITAVVNTTSLSTLFNAIYKICIGVAATLAVLQIMRAGVIYMGGDSVTEVKQAHNLIQSSLLGLALVLSPVIVFGIINPTILNLNIGFSSLAPSSIPGGSVSPTAVSNTCGNTECAAGYICSNNACVAPTSTQCPGTPISNGGVVPPSQECLCTETKGCVVEVGSLNLTGGNNSTLKCVCSG